MSVEVYEFAITIPAGTVKSAGFNSAMGMPTRVVDKIDVRVPPGPRGEMGFGIGASNTIVLPQGGATYFVMDDQYREFVLDNAITSGAWVFFGYNTGSYDHTVYVTFHVSLPYATGAVAPTGSPIPVGVIGSGGSGGSGGEGGGGGSQPPPVVPPPPVIPPPVTPPGTGGPPIILPPGNLPLPGAPAPSISPSVEELVIGAGNSGTVWLLDERGYSQITSQDDLDALINAGIPSVQLSDATHASLLAATGHQVTVTLGSETLRGILSLTQRGVRHSLITGR